MDENKPLVTYNKKADASLNRIILPKFFVLNNGRNFYMQVYKDKIVLIPIKKEEE